MRRHGVGQPVVGAPRSARVAGRSHVAGPARRPAAGARRRCGTARAGTSRPPARPGDRAVEARPQARERGQRAGRLPQMDLVARQRRARSAPKKPPPRPPPHDLAGRLGRGEHRRPSSRPRPARSLGHLRRRPDREMRAEHLAATADAEHRRARRARRKSAAPSPLARSQARSASVLFVPGRITRSAAELRGRSTKRSRTPGSCSSGSKSSKFAMRGRRTTAISIAPVRRRARPPGAEGRPPGARLPSGVEAERVFVGRRRSVQVGDDAEHRAAGPLLEEAQPGLSSAAVAAEAVDQQAAHPRALVGLEQLQRADERREHAAAVDVADEQHRRVGEPRDGHVHEVAVAQVDLGRAARALDHHDDRGSRAAAPGYRRRPASSSGLRAW